jgi:hypothetical protein
MQRAIELNPSTSDLANPTIFRNVEFINVEEGAMGRFYDPPAGWANVKDCGNFPCTGPWNTFWHFEGVTWTGRKPAFAKENFVMIPDNPGASPYIEGCVRDAINTNGWFCENNNIGQLIFESLDDDRMDRSSQPIYLNLQGTDMNNKLNAFMDHVWDGFYTG